MGLHERLVQEARGVGVSQEARDKAIEQVRRGADPAWLAAARLAVKEVGLREGARGFTTDDVWEVLDRQGYERPDEPRALGPVMMKLKREKKIVPLDVAARASVRVVCHRNPKRVWGLVSDAQPVGQER